MAATPSTIDYWLRGELPPEESPKDTTAFDYWTRGEPYAAAIVVAAAVTDPFPAAYQRAMWPIVRSW